ncbi:MAG: heme ABC transporter ATP-binding protein [Verrucomicrobiota bacterium]
MIEAEQITFGYGSNIVVDGVSVSLPAGRVTAILGPNGAGKSSLMHVLTGAMKAQQGSVHFDDKALADYAPDELARRRAVLPQSSRLTFNFTALEVVEMGRLPHLRSHDPDHHAEIINQAMQQLDVAHLAQRQYMTLSGGERQRVDLARAVAQVWPEEERLHSRALFLDEPTNNLDIRHQHDCLGIAREMAGKGLAICCVLHDLNLALRYADDCILLAGGKLIASGVRDEVMTDEILTQAFEAKVTRVQTACGTLIATEQLER